MSIGIGMVEADMTAWNLIKQELLSFWQLNVHFLDASTS
jgi:hypothetical protein